MMMMVQLGFTFNSNDIVYGNSLRTDDDGDIFLRFHFQQRYDQK